MTQSERDQILTMMSSRFDRIEDALDTLSRKTVDHAMEAERRNGALEQRLHQLEDSEGRREQRAKWMMRGVIGVAAGLVVTWFRELF